ncbi:Cys-Gln thioester bond-forming surface protein [Nocardiopsis sp. N85]|uniref:Cys-Gln thioester bond-forming surface protein n=1 Tax=Nocardiopsis sp. N85 TaxID=3029400 RepID=UPI00237EEF8A|nr:Cys-Gln thioester bond-forming surface protein [Nocardiopsis sp. N85]MDE3721665.1 Cys-Gln thioester bond-forming surface protein [Nocardiopsis sp. N85]
MDIPRRCAALLSSVVLVTVLAGTPAALADDFSRVDREPVAGVELTPVGGGTVATALYSLRIGNDDSVRAYTTSPDGEVRRRAAYVESDWSGVPAWAGGATEAAPADRAHWIVTHSYPARDLVSLSIDAGLPPMREDQAIAGTQAALWRVLSDTEPDREANDPTVLALYDHLMVGALAPEESPAAPSLSVSPEHVDAVGPEEPLGPLTVSSAGDEPMPVSLGGAPASWLVDAEGRQVTHAVDGDELYLRVEPSMPAGVVSLHVHGEDIPLAEGGLFTGRDGVRTLPLVTAEAGTATSTATATLTWHAPTPSTEPASPTPEPPTETPEPTPQEPLAEAEPSEEAVSTEDDRIVGDDLPRTGTWLSGLLVIAGALVVSGLIILILGRKRRE